MEAMPDAVLRTEQSTSHRGVAQVYDSTNAIIVLELILSDEASDIPNGH